MEQGKRKLSEAVLVYCTDVRGFLIDNVAKQGLNLVSYVAGKGFQSVYLFPL